MKTIIATILYLTATQLNAGEITIEPDANIQETNQYTLKNMRFMAIITAKMVQASGWKCDTVTSFRTFLLSTGFTLICNQYRYTYEIADKGGKWVVKLK